MGEHIPSQETVDPTGDYDRKKRAFEQANQSFQELLEKNQDLDLDALSDAALEAYKDAVQAAALRVGKALEELVEAKRKLGV